MGKGNNGQELYIKLEDLRKTKKAEVEDDEDETNDFTDINLWLDDLEIDLRWGKYYFVSPNKDGKYYLLENKGSKRFLGGKEILGGDTRANTLKQYASSNPNYIQLDQKEWVGFSQYESSDIHLEEIRACVFSTSEEQEHNFPVFLVCSPHQNTGQWNYKSAKYIAREFERREIVNY